MSITKLCIALGLALLPASGAVAQDRVAFVKPLAWQPRYQGVDYAGLAVVEPVEIRGHAVRVELSERGVGFVVTPDNGDRPNETDGLWTSRFLEKVGCQVAINANPFEPVHDEQGKPQDVKGLLVGDGSVISPAQRTLPALLIGKGNKVTIAMPPFDLSTVRHAIGGFSVVLNNGKVTARGEKRHPRTAVGVSGDGRFLFLLVIDGRQLHSAGATTGELAAWLKSLGASEGINLDGGGTSTLAMAKPGGKATVVNRPVHRWPSGQERPSGAHLGVFAKPLKPAAK